MSAYPEIEVWYLGGHSLGGAMAAGYGGARRAAVRAGALAALFHKAASGSSAGSVCVWQPDGVMNLEKYEECRVNLPKTAEEYVIEGGNHAGFGWYRGTEGRQQGGNHAAGAVEADGGGDWQMGRRQQAAGAVDLRITAGKRSKISVAKPGTITMLRKL